MHRAGSRLWTDAGRFINPATRQDIVLWMGGFSFLCRKSGEVKKALVQSMPHCKNIVLDQRRRSV
jgi:hypothetical protein